jgi:hypothetical protein
MGKDGKPRGEDRKAKKERKEREREEKRLSRQRAPSVGSDQGGFEDPLPSPHGALMVPPLSLLGGSNGATGTADEQLGPNALDSTKSPTSFLLDQMTTMLALMNGHHQHEVARLTIDGLLDTLARVPSPLLRFRSFYSSFSFFFI